MTFSRFDLAEEVFKRWQFGPFWFELSTDPRKHPRLARWIWGHHGSAVLDSEVYESIMETIDILSDPETMVAIAEAEAELEA